jgi:hypothetical protein
LGWMKREKLESEWGIVMKPLKNIQPCDVEKKKRSPVLCEMRLGDNMVTMVRDLPPIPLDLWTWIPYSTGRCF